MDARRDRLVRAARVYEKAVYWHTRRRAEDDGSPAAIERHAQALARTGRAKEHFHAAVRELEARQPATALWAVRETMARQQTIAAIAELHARRKGERLVFAAGFGAVQRVG
jgi:hypothetical protein